MQQQCEPGDRACVNRRRFYQSDFRRPNPYDDVKHGGPNTQRPTSAGKESDNFGDDDHQYRASTLRVPRPLKPSIRDLTPEQMNKAKMVEASRLAYEKDFTAAQTYLDREGVPNDIDVSLSSKASLVLVGDDGVKIAYRGTKIKDVSDVTTDAAIAVGVEAHHPQFKSAEEQLTLVTEKYGAPNELLGYSLGGNKAITMGNAHGIDTLTFNPFLGKNLLASKSEATHNILRTTEDFASIGIGLTRGKDNWNISSILPHKDKLNPIEAHKLSNFTQTSARRPGQTETLLKAVQQAGQKAGELELMDSMKTAQEKGQSFTEFVHEFNSGTGQDTTADGSRLAGTRMHRNSKWVKYWEESKEVGSSNPAFSPEETAHLDSIPRSEVVYDPAIRPKERAEFRAKPPSERAKAIKKSHERLKTVAEAVDTHTEPYKASANVLKRAIHPTNVLTGVVGGAAANALMNQIDKDHHIEENTRTGLEGTAAGVMAEMGAAALAGTALTAGGVGVAGAAGAASYVAGAKSAEGVTKGLEAAGVDEDTSEGMGALSGGAVGGGVAAGTAIGGAALLGAEIGELGGPVGLALGAGVGAVVGTAGWLIGKLF